MVRREQLFQRAAPGLLHPTDDHGSVTRVEDAAARVKTGATVAVLVNDRLHRAATLVRLRSQHGGQLVTALFQLDALLLCRLQRVDRRSGKPRQLDFLAAHLAQSHPDRVEVARKRNHYRVGGLGGLAHRSEPQVPTALREQRLQFCDCGRGYANRRERRVLAGRNRGQIDSQRRPRRNLRDTLAQRLQVGHHLIVLGGALLEFGPVRKYVDRCHELIELGVVHGRR